MINIKEEIYSCDLRQWCYENCHYRQFLIKATYEDGELIKTERKAISHNCILYKGDK